MMSLFGEVGVIFVNTYKEFLGILPPIVQDFINLFLISLIIVIYAILIWKFYRFISKRNLIELDLRQYNKLSHRGMAKTVSILLFTLEYLIILPFMVFFWFSMFTIFLIILTKEISKLLPYTLLAVSIIRGGIFSFDKILGQLFAIPNFFPKIFSYLFFIFVMEFLLRSIETIFVTTGVNDVTEIAKVPEL